MIQSKFFISGCVIIIKNKNFDSLEIKQQQYSSKNKSYKKTKNKLIKRPFYIYNNNNNNKSLKNSEYTLKYSVETLKARHLHIIIIQLPLSLSLSPRFYNNINIIRTF